MRRVLFAALAGLVALVVIDFSTDEASDKSASSGSAKSGGPGDPAARPRDGAESRSPTQFVFRERAPFGETQGALFDSHEWQSSSPATAAVAVLAPPPPPVAPPMPYQFSGAFISEGQLQIFLAKGDSILSVGLGETIEGGYRVDAIDEREITLIYLPLGQKQVVPVSTSVSFAGARLPTAADSAASRGSAVSANSAGDSLVLIRDERQPSRPAQFSWHGPQTVRVGAQFSVALRVTSTQPVRASPMQINVDPLLLETVSVRAGQFFGEGERNFTYRMNHDGSIFVGATSPNPAPAANAEFVVLTFKSRKPAPAAELSVASLSLHGPAGQVIAFDPLAAFKTAITP